MSVASYLMQEAINDERSMFFVAPAGHMSVNSNVGWVVTTASVRTTLLLINLCRIGWHSAHFGFPGKTRFHTSGINDRYVRVFSSNPPAIGEGELCPTLDVVFAVASSIRDAVYDDIMSSLNADNFPDNIL